MSNIDNKTIFITGASRGIGRAIALRCAQAGANIVIAAKSSEPHPKLPGTIHSVAEEVKSLGVDALAIELDVRKEIAVKKALQVAAEKFGGIDGIVNNAGAISLTGVEATSPKRYDLMQSVNHRAVYTLSHYGLPYLKKSQRAHILSLSPPLNMDPKWLKDYSPYTLSKYGMTILTLGMAEEFKAFGIGVNCLWPKTMIATAAIEFAVGNKDSLKHCRKPEIMADAAYEVLSSCPKDFTGQTLLDESLLESRDYRDLETYRVDSDYELFPDLFI